MPHFIVATDLSDRGDRAVHRAILLAAERKARLMVLSVIDDALPAALAGPLRQAAEAELKRIAGSFRQAAAAELDFVVVSGDPAHAVAEAARTAKADLLIVGRHRDRPFADLFRQTTVERIVALADCPVLLVATAPDGPYRSVLAAVDFSPASAAAVEHALALAPDAAHSGIHIYHVPYRGLMPGDSNPAFLHEAEHEEARWRQTVAADTARLPIRLVEGGVQSELIQAIASARPDLVVLGAHGRNTLSTRLLGSVAAMLIREPRCDLLIARPKRRHLG